LQSKHNWGLLGPYPHHADGDPEAHAFRNGMTLRERNQMEGHFSRTQVGLNMAVSGTTRTRFQDIETVESLHWVSELRICSAVLAAERAARGEAPPPLPGTEHLVDPIGDLPQAPALLPPSRRGRRRSARPRRGSGTPSSP